MYDPTTEILILNVIFSALVGLWAMKWGRSFLIWFIVPLFISPLVTSIILLIFGKTDELKAEQEALKIARIRNILGEKDSTT